MSIFLVFMYGLCLDMSPMSSMSPKNHVRYIPKRNGSMQKLQVLQNNLMRMMLGKKREDRISVDTLLQETGFQSVNQMIVQHTSGEMHKILNKDSIPFIQEMVVKKEIGSYTMRSKDDGKLQVIPIKDKLSGFVQNSAKIWNQLPQEMRTMKKQQAFSNRIKKWLSDVPL